MHPVNDRRRLTALHFQQSEGVGDWRVLAFGANAWFATSSHAAGAELARRALSIGAAARHLPEVDVRATGVRVRTRSADVSGLTDDDVELARRISVAARELDLVADPSVLQTVQLTIDTAQKASLMGFWRTALAYDEVGDDLLVDPSRRDPSIWFQDMEAERPLRNRFHLDVGVSPESAHERVASTEAAGGRVVRSSGYHAAIADVDGNEVDVVPLQPDGDLTDAPERADWRVLFSAIVHYPTDDAAIAADLAAAAAAIADDAGVELLIDVRPSGVTVDSG